MEKDKKLYEFNSLEFLNAGVDEIYYRKKHYISGKDTMFLKSMVASESSFLFYMRDFMTKIIV